MRKYRFEGKLIFRIKYIFQKVLNKASKFWEVKEGVHPKGFRRIDKEGSIGLKWV
jgi:hypothetical protein